MVIDVFEVYGDGPIYLIFLTEQEAKYQTILLPSTGIYSAKVFLTDEEYYELTHQRCMLVNN